MSLLHNPSPAELRRMGTRPFEPLAPVLVSPSAQEIFAAYPEVEDLHRLPVDLFDAPILTDENLKNNGVSREERRGNPLEPKLHIAAKKAVLSAAHVLRAVPDPAARQEAYRFLIQEWEQDRGVQADDQVYLRIALNSIDINEGVAYVVGLNSYSHPVQQRILESVQDSTANQYQLLKLLASVQSQEVLDDLEEGVNAQNHQALRWTTLLALVRSDRQSSPVAELLAKRLIQGDFDHYLARDMLDYANSYDTEGQLPEPVAALKSMISLVEHSAGTPADGQMLARMADGFNLGVWPKEQQVVVLKQRKVLLDTLDFLTRTVVKEFTAGVITVEDCDYKSYLYKSFDELAELDTDTSIQTIRSVGETATAGSLKRRNQPRAEENQQILDEPETETSPEKEPLKLMYVDGHGYLYDADSKEFTNMVADYLEKRQNTPHLEEDLRKILDYIASLDFSNGGVRGLRKIDEAYLPIMIDGSLKDFPLWELKPDKANGLSLVSDTARRTRVFFCMPPGANMLVIRDIERRTDNRNKLLKRPRGKKRSRRK